MTRSAANPAPLPVSRGYFWFWLLSGWLSVLLGSMARGEEFQSVDAVTWSGHLVVLKGDGSFATWRMVDGEGDAEMARALALPKAVHLASQGPRLWATDGGSLFERRIGISQWAKITTLPTSDAPLLTILPVGEVPLLVYATRVFDPRTGRIFEVPELHGQLEIRALSLRAAFSTQTMAWFGTGYGEWGGHLVGLKVKDGTWVQYYDALHYVTGITADHERLVVAWAMSHFMASTLIREHDDSGQPSREERRLTDRYYQRVAYSAFDKVLYGVENQRLVRIVKGEPEEIAELPGRLFEPEPMAIGVAPGIRAVIPSAYGLVFVVPNQGLPLRVDTRSRNVRSLPEAR